jgi:branched-chain amino acid transport system permease protein
MKHQHVRLSIVIGFAALAILLPFITRNLYYLHVATVIAVYWVLIATLNLLVGFTGQLSIGHVGLLAVGAYTFCLLAGFHDWSPFLAMLAGGGICAVLGLALGLPSLRLPGFYFAMATLAFGMIVSELALAEQWLTNGSVGMPAPSFPAPFDTPWGFYWLVLAIAAFVTWMTANLARLMWGRAMVALRDSAVAASSVAVPIYIVKLLVFIFSGFTAGIAGGLYATSQTYITPDAFIVNLGIYFFVAIIIGGRGVIIGPFIGAAVLAAIPVLVAPLAKYGTFFYGVILLIVVLVIPGGFGELIAKITTRLRRERPVSTTIEPDLDGLAAAIGTDRKP